MPHATDAKLKAYQRYVQKHLEEITLILQKVSFGDFSVRVEIPKKEDEFTELYVFLSLMTDDLKGMVEELEEAKAGLEKKVEARTKDLRKSLEKLQELDRLKNQFISVVSHEFRTPLSVIRWNADLLGEKLKEGKTARKSLRELESIQVGVRFLIDTLGNIFDILAIEGGYFSLQAQPIQIWEILDEVVNEFRSYAQYRRVKIIFNKETIPLKELSADPKSVRRVLETILRNAIEYNNPLGGKVILALEEAREGNADGLRVIVEDTGIGIGPKELESVCHKFFRGRRARKRAPNGAGLGLFIAKHVIEAHGGNIRISSKLNKGTRVSVFLPIAPPG